MKKRITLSIDERLRELVRRVAARRGLSLSAVVREQIEALARAEESYDAAREAALAWMEHDASLGAVPREDRGSLHDRGE